METVIDLTEIRIVAAIAQIRDEWQEAMEGESLMSVEAPVGFILGDLVMGINLPINARAIALGDDLLQEYEQLVRSI